MTNTLGSACVQAFSSVSFFFPRNQLINQSQLEAKTRDSCQAQEKTHGSSHDWFGFAPSLLVFVGNTRKPTLSQSNEADIL